jgi:branched-chain amino acid transport system ATP-binding protein
MHILFNENDGRSLAPMIVDEIFELIGKLSREGTPIVLVEQNVHRAIRLTTRHYLIERGQVVAEGNSSDPGDRQALMGRISV